MSKSRMLPSISEIIDYIMAHPPENLLFPSNPQDSGRTTIALASLKARSIEEKARDKVYTMYTGIVPRSYERFESELSPAVQRLMDAAMDDFIEAARAEGIILKDPRNAYTYPNGTVSNIE